MKHYRHNKMEKTQKAIACLILISQLLISCQPQNKTTQPEPPSSGLQVLRADLDELKVDDTEKFEEWLEKAGNYEEDGSVFGEIIYEHLVKLRCPKAIFSLASLSQDAGKKDDKSILLYDTAAYMGHDESARFLGEILMYKFEQFEAAEYYLLKAKSLSESQDVIAMDFLCELYEKGSRSYKIPELKKAISEVDLEWVEGCDLSTAIILKARAWLETYKKLPQQPISKPIIPKYIFKQACEDYFKEHKIKPVDCFYSHYPEGSTMLGFEQIEPVEFFSLRVLSHNIPHWVVGIVDNNKVLHIFDGNADISVNAIQDIVPSYLNLGNINQKYKSIKVHNMHLQMEIGINACGYICRHMIELFQLCGYQNQFGLPADKQEYMEQNLHQEILDAIKDDIYEEKNIFAIN